MTRKQISAYRNLVIGFFCLLVQVLVPAHGVSAGGSPVSAVDAVRSSDLVIVGRVIGLVDQKPGAMHRRARERHWVDVVKTLKGNDESGERFAVLPLGRAWQDGREYILFLERGESNFAKAQHIADLPATGNNIAAVMREIASQGVGLLPRRAYRVRHVGGWQRAPVTEFIVTEDFRFIWSRRQSGGANVTGTEVLRGVLPKAALVSLVGGAEGFSSAIAGDDEDKVTIYWRDAGGRKQRKELGGASGASAKSVLREIEGLARRHRQF